MESAGWLGLQMTRRNLRRTDGTPNSLTDLSQSVSVESGLTNSDGKSKEDTMDFDFSGSRFETNCLGGCYERKKFFLGFRRDSGAIKRNPSLNQITDFIECFELFALTSEDFHHFGCPNEQVRD